ncbi:hypothetical protein HK100_002630 [Physocladia obscura]|uniref:Uncharacterized protein n=1 Tax=Physocladia obscura TaxID=109957 RepID=A0AAD5XDQ7_9FUNG|nr:hypothetical protein HK100_002630 [Physocladia obscura]
MTMRATLSMHANETRKATEALRVLMSALAALGIKERDKKPSKGNIVLKLQAEIENLEMNLIDERGNLNRITNELGNSDFLNEQLNNARFNLILKIQTEIAFINRMYLKLERLQRIICQKLFLQQELQDALFHLKQVESDHFQKENELENEIRDLHVQLSQQAQERAMELEQCIAHYKARTYQNSEGTMMPKHRFFEPKYPKFNCLSEIAVSEMNMLRYKLEAQTRKLHEIEDQWRIEKGSREVVVMANIEQRDMQLREVEKCRRRVLDDERVFLREEIGVRDVKVSEM